MEDTATVSPTPVELVLYDFDGTCIRGNSPVLLVRYLLLHRKLNFFRALGIGLWAVAYKLRLPQNESWVRSQVFTAFVGQKASEVDDYLMSFYDEVIAERVRESAIASMEEHRAAGRVVVIVSATWEAIVRRAMDFLPIDHAVCTCMEIDDAQCYTRIVKGLPVEGAEKVSALRRYADDAFGKGTWMVSYAYGDHHSDVPMLEMAQHPVAVTPDSTLTREARRNEWQIAHWQD
ncbi:HAD family phosphatase [Denitrobacterium detoxificans]|jgi:HAD superfamily hydrolase (TIGR01490 family)|uniref:HAD family hydrolase n=1 Tax=Denitrobacterium detoxificans TaxID=79604 RepID=UPI0026EDA526|nr:HAD-IB family hydrolase [Denitrobacterium detoxificans]MBE6465257.1 HAD-IB family hydrolase [Denitrobacterium detoxificans]